jgi:hypothetical protein
MPSAAQVKARANFKKKIADAKKIKAKNPKKPWKTCVKEAFQK